MNDSITAGVKKFYEERHDAIEGHRLVRRYYRATLIQGLKDRIIPGQRVLDIGCGTGDLLATLRPSYGVGVDLSRRAIETARAAHRGEQLHFVEGDGSDPAVLRELGGPFDVILLVNVVTHLRDVQATLEALQAVSHARTRIFIYSFSRVWQPLIRLSEMLGLKERQPFESWLPSEEVRHMLQLADYEIVRQDNLIFCPAGIPLVAPLLNRYVGHLPFIEIGAVMFGLIARPIPARHAGARSAQPSVSVIIPCRNEAGHIPELVRRLPNLPPNSEFLFVEGNSTDDTEAAIRKAITDHPDRPLRFLKQRGKGKGDAVRLGFAEARGEVLLILDSDMGVAPEDIMKFVEALARGKGEMINGSRMVYPMENQAMRFLNLLANKFFAFLFSWLLGQQVRDTLCGTKVLYRADYERIAANRAYFGDFDPFGDFDLLFGAARLNLRIIDLAVRYHQRTYGTTNISRFRHGLLLLRMSLFAARRLKFH